MTKELFIKDIMAKPTTISKSAKITEALDKMLDEGIDPLIALNNNSVVTGIPPGYRGEGLGSRQNTALAQAAIHVASVSRRISRVSIPMRARTCLSPCSSGAKLVVVYDSDHNLLGQVTAIDLLKKYRTRAPSKMPLKRPSPSMRMSVSSTSGA